MDSKDIGCAKKIGVLISDFYNIAQVRFGKSFKVRLHEFDIDREIEKATIIHLKRRTTQKTGLLITYFAPKGFPEQIKEYNIEFLHEINLYHKRILHEYAVVFLFHDDILNPPNDQKIYLELDKNDICNHFVKALLKLC